MAERKPLKPTTKRPLERESTRQLIQSIADLNNLPYSTVEYIYLTQWKFIKAVIEEGYFKSVLIPSLGKFVVKPYRLKKQLEKYTKYGPFIPDYRPIDLKSKGKRGPKKGSKRKPKVVSINNGEVKVNISGLEGNDTQRQENVSNS